jgi:MbtH protein
MDIAENFVVVRNDEEQYSIWSATRELPAGWLPDGAAGSKEECLAHIEKVWTDMRPASLRRATASVSADD